MKGFLVLKARLKIIFPQNFESIALLSIACNVNLVPLAVSSTVRKSYVQRCGTSWQMLNDID